MESSAWAWYDRRPYYNDGSDAYDIQSVSNDVYHKHYVFVNDLIQFNPYVPSLLYATGWTNLDPLIVFYMLTTINSEIQLLNIRWDHNYRSKK